MTCLDCESKATWIRYTQFAGNHPFCEEHAKTQDNFGKSDPSYYGWEALTPDNTED